MCPRSHTSGLISVEWTRSRSRSEIDATRPSVRSRASWRAATVSPASNPGPAALTLRIGPIVASRPSRPLAASADLVGGAEPAQDGRQRELGRVEELERDLGGAAAEVELGGGEHDDARLGLLE